MRTRLSRDAYDRLKAEFDDLYGRGRIEIAQRIEAARELGDLKENGDYHAAKEEQGKMDLRMRQIQAIIDDPEIVDDVDTSMVNIGTVVAVVYEGDDEVERYLVGSIEEKRPGLDVVSPTSPLGSALLGRLVGELVSYQAPNGTLRVKIHEITA